MKNLAAMFMAAVLVTGICACQKSGSTGSGRTGPGLATSDETASVSSVSGARDSEVSTARKIQIIYFGSPG